MSELARLDDDAPTTLSLAPARADTDSWAGIVVQVSRLAQEVAGTSFVPKGLRNDVPATTAAILYGREVGFPPMTALTQIHVIEGRPGMAAEGMRALVLAAGHELVFEESTGALCRMRGRRRGSTSWTTLQWSLDMARAAGLLGKDNWRSYPRAMLVARCSTDLCRMIFPDVVHGFRSVEELDDMGPAPELAPASTTTVRRRASSRRPAVSPPRAPGAGDLTRSPETAGPGPSSPDLVGPPLPGEEGHPDASAAGLESRPPVADAPTTYDETASDPGPDEVPPPVVVPHSRPAEAAPPTAERSASYGRRPEAEVVPPGPRMVNRPTLKLMFREFNRLGIDDAQRDERLALLAEIVGHPLASSNDLTQEEGVRVLTMLTTSRDLGSLAILVDATTPPIPDEDDTPLPDPEEETS